MLDGLPGGKFELKCLLPSGKVGGKMPAPARGERQSQTNLDESREAFHRNNPAVQVLAAAMD